MNIRELMTPKSEEKILKSLKGLNNSELLKKSIDNEFIKGVKIALQNELTNNDIDLIKYKIFNINNKKIITLLLDRIKYYLTEDQIYIIKKYQIGLYKDEEKPYEIWFKEMLTDLTVKKSIYNIDCLIYKKNKIIIYNCEKKYEYFWINYDKIWFVFEKKYHLNYDEIKLLTKSMVEKYLNLKNITVFMSKENILTKK
jgi:hypothetical protein